jgi:hypothetical protein
VKASLVLVAQVVPGTPLHDDVLAQVAVHVPQ